MGNVSYLVMALGVLNLLLVASGFLLVFFDWSAARRREFLYLYLTEEKPGSGYFSAARRRRAQYVRFLAAFVILFFHAFLSAVVYASISDINKWDLWQKWWLSGFKLTPSELGAGLLYSSQLQVWMCCLEMLGLALLALGFLYKPPPPERTSKADFVAGVFMACWAIFVLIIALGLFRGNTMAVTNSVAFVVRIMIVTCAAYFALRHSEEDVERGLLAYQPLVLASAFGVWLLTHVMRDLLKNPGLAPVGEAVTYFLLVSIIAKGVLTEYESVESSRHRLGRERQVIVSFLRRIGAAFTTEVEIEQVLRIILESALDTTEASAGAIYLYQADRRILEPRVVLHFFPPLYVDTPAALSSHRTEELEEEMKHQSFALGEGVIGAVAQSGEPQIIPDVRAAGVMRGTTADYMRNRSLLVVPLRIRDEPLGVMAVLNKQRGSFGREDQSLLQALADQGALFINNAILTIEVGQQERLQRELQIARDIQQRLLPKECPIVPGFEIAARGTSATEVGGDYYDFFWVDDDHLGILVADVSGKGVHAALVVAMIRSAFRTQARGNPDVREVLCSVNEYISMDLRRDMFITCIYGILEVSTKKFSWGRAGHEPIIVAHPSDDIDVLSPEGFALGVVGSPVFGESLEVKTVSLNPGDRILLFTDGLTEAMNAKGEEFGMHRILHVMGHANGGARIYEGVGADHCFPGGGEPALTTNNNRPLEQEAVILPGDHVSGSLLNKSPCEPGPSTEEPEDLKSIERAVQTHVGDAPQSDDLTIVYVGAT